MVVYDPLVCRPDRRVHKPCLLTTRELRSDYAATAPVQVDPSPKLGASTAEPPRAWAESVGAWIAATTSTSVVALRIGYFAEQTSRR